jgi:transposase-like protein
VGKRFSDAQRQQIVANWREHGTSATARRFGCSNSTVKRFVVAAGIDASQDSRDRLAAAAVSGKARRAELRVKLLKQAMTLIDRMGEKHVEYRGARAIPIEHDHATATECRDYALAVAILIDKFRLEMGDCDSRRETITPDEVDAEIARLEAQIAAEGHDASGDLDA